MAHPQLDVKNTFLHHNPTKEVYMKQNPRYVDHNHHEYVSRLWNAFYELKQSPHAWYHNHLDPIDILLYVNEIIFMAFNSYLIQQVITCLSSKFYMTDLGPPSFFIDITSTCVIHGIFISLIVFAKEILS